MLISQNRKYRYTPLSYHNDYGLFRLIDSFISFDRQLQLT